MNAYRVLNSLTCTAGDGCCQVADNQDQGCGDSPVAVLCGRQGSGHRAILFCQAGCAAGPGAGAAGPALGKR